MEWVFIVLIVLILALSWVAKFVGNILVLLLFGLAYLLSSLIQHFRSKPSRNGKKAI